MVEQPASRRSMALFYSYAHEDETLLNELKVRLKPLQRQGFINEWHDRDITAGTEWEREISKHLDTADIILLLVSPNFMDSDYCYSIEMDHALARHERGEARVIPIILRPCGWLSAPFAKLQVLPTDGRSVTRWPDRDEAWMNVTNGICKALGERQNGREEKEVPSSEERQLQPGFMPPSSSPLGRRSQRALVLVGVALLIVLLFSALFWTYTLSMRSTSSTPTPTTTLATRTPNSELIYTVKNTDEILPDGVYFQHSLQPDPIHPTPTPTPGFGVYKNEQVHVSCWAWGSVWYGNQVWYYVENVTRPTWKGRSNKGWINAHYVDDGMPANRPAPGIPQCKSPLPVGG